MSNKPNTKRQKVSKKDSFLRAQDVLGNLHLLAPDDKEDIHEFLKSSPNSTNCQTQRCRLLESRDKLRLSLICWQLAFATACPDYQEEKPAEWREFDEEVRSNRTETDSIMRCILTISECWGEDVVCHYAWRLSGLYSCNKLRFLAKRLPKWPVVAMLLNHSILKRIHSTDKRTPEVKNNANPIEPSDLDYVKGLTEQQIQNTVDLFELPSGYGRDNYGLIVREQFAGLPLLQLPSPSPQQYQSPKTTFRSTGYDGSALVRSPLFQGAGIMPLSRPRSVSAGSNEPTSAPEDDSSVEASLLVSRSPSSSPGITANPQASGSDSTSTSTSISPPASPPRSPSASPQASTSAQAVLRHQSNKDEDLRTIDADSITDPGHNCSSHCPDAKDTLAISSEDYSEIDSNGHSGDPSASIGDSTTSPQAIAAGNVLTHQTLPQVLKRFSVRNITFTHFNDQLT